jgi:transposase
VNQAKFLGETIAAKLVGEIGDVRRFESKRSLVAYAGVDPGKSDSGKKVSAKEFCVNKAKFIAAKSRAPATRSCAKPFFRRWCVICLPRPPR